MVLINKKNTMYDHMQEMFNSLLHTICTFTKFYSNVQANRSVGINSSLSGGTYDKKSSDGILSNFSLFF